MKRVLYILLTLSGLCFAQAPPEETPMRNLMRSKGDQITHNGIGPVRLPACPDGQVHVADSTQAVGYSCLPNGQAAGAVTSVFGRTGAVVALSADYGTFYAPITHTHIIADVTGLQTALNGKQDALGYTAENTANKGVSSGYAPLDAGAKIPVSFIPSLNYQAPLGFTPENTSNKGAASGYAPLDATSKVPTTNLPTVAAQLGFTPENVANKTVDTTFGGASPSNTLYPSQAAVKTYSDSHLQGRAVSATAPADLQVLQWSQTNSQWQPATISGGGITSLNGLTALTQTFADSNDTNVTLSISSVTSTHTFTLGWTGALAKARQHAATVYNDQANTYSGAFTQDFSAISHVRLPVASAYTPSLTGHLGYDSTSNTYKGFNGTAVKTFAFTDSNITGNAATATVLAALPTQCGSNLYSTGIAASGNANCSQVAYSQLSGTPTLFYQTVQANAVSQTQRGTINFSTEFTVADNSGAGRTDVSLNSVAASKVTGNIVSLSMPAEFSVSGSPATVGGTLTVTKATQGANTVYAGPASGAAAAPSFRSLVSTDLPSTTISQVTNDGTTGTTVNQLAKINTSGNAVNAATTDTAVPVFVVVGGAGTTGSAQLATSGQAACKTDGGGATIGHFLVASTTTAGTCHDAGATAPTSGWVIGQALTTAAAAANTTMQLAQGFNATSGGGGVTKLTGNSTFTFASAIADGSCSQSATTITVTGAAVGDPAPVGANPSLPNGVNVIGKVTSVNTVTVEVCNSSGASYTPGSTTYTATIIH